MTQDPTPTPTADPVRGARRCIRAHSLSNTLSTQRRGCGNDLDKGVGGGSQVLYFSGLLARTALRGKVLLRIGLAIVVWWACRYSVAALAALTLSPGPSTTAAAAAGGEAGRPEVQGGSIASSTTKAATNPIWRFGRSVLTFIAGMSPEKLRVCHLGFCGFL